MPFYRYFLLRLFHEGLGQRRQDRAPELEQLLGRIPYLNGGLFDVHVLELPERYGTKIHIPDAAFASIFTYFDQYQWHLDERPLRKDNEINPDVLGYIFEKYINQKQMGAYYTKEDITEYISKNTVLPFLFEAAFSHLNTPLSCQSGGVKLWDLLRDNPDRYIYPAVRHGVDKPLPEEIAVGLDTNAPDLIVRRQAWNKPAPAEYALPTEIWREVVARRQRYQAVRAQLTSGAVRDIRDFITFNLDVRQFAQDVVENCAEPDLLMAMWQAVSNITVLDPTGGSGAFIFAALNILESLYVACLERMEAFIAEWGRSGGANLHTIYHTQFSAVLARVNAHPNRRYFVLKSIMLNNLYAVDIMAEAVEICKLRLFLKLAAQVDPDLDHPNLGLEPLPDIDFNIRVGNSLIGYATYAEVERVITSKLDLCNVMAKIAAKAGDLQRTFDKFRQLQTEGDGSVPHKHKQELQSRLQALEDELNQHLAHEYAVDTNDAVAYAQWVKSHQPFHWFVQFYGILQRGGFDVVIGNPPYVEYSQVRKDYTVQDYDTESCGNLYAYVIERCFSIMRSAGRMGMIVQLPFVCTDRMKHLQNKCITSSAAAWFANFDDRPAKLFDGLEHIRATIFTLKKANQGNPYQIHSTTYNRWYSEARNSLFANISFENVTEFLVSGSIPKIGHQIAKDVRLKIGKFATLRINLNSRRDAALYFHNAPQYWIRAMTFVPYSWKEKGGEQISTQIKILNTTNELDASAIAASLNSSLFYWWFIVLSDCRHLNLREIELFPIGIDSMSDSTKRKLEQLSHALMADLNTHKQRKETVYKATGKVIYDEFYPRYSKAIIDEIDTVLAQHYGFTAEELDFIINYDIKYRMGRNNETDE